MSEFAIQRRKAAITRIEEMAGQLAEQYDLQPLAITALRRRYPTHVEAARGAQEMEALASFVEALAAKVAA